MTAFDGKSGLVTSSNASDYHRNTGPSPEQLREEANRKEYEAAKAEHERKEAALRAHVEERMPYALRANQQYQAALANGGNRGTGQAMTEGEKAQAAAAKPITGVPAVVVDRLNLKLGGVELSPAEAKAWLADGSVSQAQYNAALNTALVKNGYGIYAAPSF